MVVDGVVDAGQHGWAGEIGHLTVEPSGPQCGCGSTGCLEVYA
ncbi:ROK family protein [Nesterenkonia pannonica]|nr:ROK family protein [Nesterenkonia pannonica]